MFGQALETFFFMTKVFFFVIFNVLYSYEKNFIVYI